MDEFSIVINYRKYWHTFWVAEIKERLAKYQQHVKHIVATNIKNGVQSVCLSAYWSHVKIPGKEG